MARPFRRPMDRTLCATVGCATRLLPVAGALACPICGYRQVESTAPVPRPRRARRSPRGGSRR